jgi:antitoxin component YwqK of YwqJK toxin-antitoxin module
MRSDRTSSSVILNVICALFGIFLSVSARAQTPDTAQSGPATGLLDSAGKKTGEWRYRYLEGELRAIEHYDHGKPVGEWKYYHRNGQLDRVEHYKYGKREGEWWQYNGKSRLARRVKYKDGKRVGKEQTWYESGKLSSVLKYKNGHPKTMKNYDEEGRLTSEVKWLTDSLREEKGYHWNGKTRCAGRTEIDTAGISRGLGKWKFYYENGLVMSEGEFAHGSVMIGEWKLYHENGKLSRVEQYENGRRAGRKCFDLNGEPAVCEN